MAKTKLKEHRRTIAFPGDVDQALRKAAALTRRDVSRLVVIAAEQMAKHILAAGTDVPGAVWIEKKAGTK